MRFWHRIVFSFAAAGLGVGLGGCEPSGQSAADDQKEPHFVLGLNRAKAMDYQGAVEAFEASLEANPHSAPAHYQLAWIYENKETNSAAAIYHYQEYLRFDPKAPNAGVVADRIKACKMQLADALFPSPTASAGQQQLQLLTDKNRQLQDEVDKWQAYYASQTAAVKTNQPPTPNNPAPQLATPMVPSEAVAAISKPRTHAVAAGETPAAIARKYGVNLNALLAANPGLDPRKLRVGQVLNLPPP
jgi:LysM repeat protein